MLGFLFRRGNLRAGCNHHGHPNSDRIAEEQVALRKVHVVTPMDREESNKLEADLRRMGYLRLWEKSWRVRSKDMVRELVTEEVDRIYASTIWADRIGGMRNCGVVFTDSNREGKVYMAT